MKEYLINVGQFNVIVLPDERRYFLLGEGDESAAIQSRFVQGQDIAYDSMKPHWFPYEQDETWTDFNGKSYRLGEDVSEEQLIDMYVLKKFNFGSLVAVRESGGGKVRTFKRDMLATKGRG